MEDDDLYTRITLRIPKSLHQRLSEQAKATSKSLNAEIIGSLEESANLRQQMGELHRQMQVLNQVLENTQHELSRRKKTDTDQWNTFLDESSQLRKEAELYRMRYHELATLFNAYYAVIESAFEGGKLTAEDLGAGRQVVALIAELLEQSEYRTVAQAVQHFLTGREHPVAAAAVKDAIDLLCKAGWHLSTYLDQKEAKVEGMKKRSPNNRQP
ncbi:toxin-antitoxin system HicB family antitoxin [Comamonas odontotermitis]|uniref:toxin-antitoxin system HicB family antitoxin n=1 Tax=Comamonas odontotermitis TaxID=379895 RepID=UPI001CC529C1|nr:toxin-antitoxin system HicB family antitoxin [Comamonas odontotermitis]UBB16163.1 toxin-antitoxin system HicB family antitoxin [Comamonas odontotermitis]